jgi:hypothetical protein
MSQTKKQASKVLNEIQEEVSSIIIAIEKGSNVDYEDIQEFDFIALRLSNIQRKLQKLLE